jgi:SAM-dependent methyltransferase
VPAVDEPGATWRNAERRRARFEANAQVYDTYRPGYPAETFDDLVSIAGLNRGDPVVELGSGTGIATLPLVERGLSVTCVEPGTEMSSIARQKLTGQQGVTFVQSRFEDWPAPPASATAVIAANAWHWVDPSIGYQQAATVLGPTGHLCLIFHRVVNVGPAGFDEELRAVRDAISPVTTSDLEAMAFLNGQVWSDDMEASGLFDFVARTAHGFSRELTSEAFVQVANTYGPNSQLDPRQLERLRHAVTTLIDERYGGVIAKSEEAVLYVGCRRVGR